MHRFRKILNKCIQKLYETIVRLAYKNNIIIGGTMKRAEYATASPADRT